MIKMMLLRKAIRCHVCDKLLATEDERIEKRMFWIYITTAVMTAIKNIGKRCMKDMAEQECADLEPATKKARGYQIKSG
ncbi:hypothetical protein J4434_04020 [Candidatus Woesearchaeota archaeon]|nr:hypothetical protein [Candidatus Woesearchaeota archaeon]